MTDLPKTIFVFLFSSLALTGQTFTENKGQVHDQHNQLRNDVLFTGMQNGVGFHLRKTGISYQFQRVDSWTTIQGPATGRSSMKNISMPDLITVARLDLEWLGSESGCEVMKDARTETVNFYHHSPIADVGSYTGVTYKSIYPGIDLHYYAFKGHLKYDFIVAPGADHTKIRIRIGGAERVEIGTNGSIVIETALGKLHEDAPLVYQGGKTISSQWHLENNVLSFDIGAHDPALPLVIDPLSRTWGTYYGDTHTYAWNSCTDDAGNTFMTGTSNKTTLATSGVFQTQIIGTSSGYLAKFNSAGIRQWATYFGSGPWSWSCTLDQQGNVYVAGTVYSSATSGISSAGAFQTSYGGGQFDAFLIKFSPQGQRKWGSFYGGPGDEEGEQTITDKSGHVYLAGTARTPNSGTLLTTPGSHQPLPVWDDVFLVQFDTLGNRLWGTYYGDQGEETYASCAVDHQDNVFLSGCTSSSINIATPNSYQPQKSAGPHSYDGFLAKFDMSGARQWGTYYGGISSEYPHCCTSDAIGNIYAAGHVISPSTDFATPGAHQTSSGGGGDAFLIKFDNQGARQWATYYGGAGGEMAEVCKVDKGGNILMAGSTYSSTSGISSPAAYQAVLSGTNDAFIAKFDHTGMRDWGSYYGGTSWDQAWGLGIDQQNNIYLAGYTNSQDTLTMASPGAFQTSGGYAISAFLAKFSECMSPLPAPVLTMPGSVYCYSATSMLSANGSGVLNWYATPSGTILGSGQAYVTPLLPAGSHTFYVQAVSQCTASPVTPAVIQIAPLPTIGITSSPSPVCAGETVSITLTGAATYSNHSNAVGGTFTVSPGGSTVLHISGASAEGCRSEVSAPLAVDLCAGLDGSSGEELVVIYPNPSHGHLFVSTAQQCDIEIMNQLSQCVFKSSAGEGLNKLSLEPLPPGIYFVRVSTGPGPASLKKIIIE